MRDDIGGSAGPNQDLVRPARPGDIERMAELLGALFRIEKDFVPDTGKQVRGLRALVADPSGCSCVLVAEQGGLIAGMITVQTLISKTEGGKVGLIEDLVVDQACSGLGIGSVLLHAAEMWSRERGLARLQLLADRQNHRTVDFYVHRRWKQHRFHLPSQTSGLTETFPLFLYLVQY